MSDNFLIKTAKENSLMKIINEEKSEDFPNLLCSPITGKVLGYEESDEHFKNRVMKKIKGE